MKYKKWKSVEEVKKDINKPVTWSLILEKANPFLNNIQIPLYKEKYQLLLKFIEKMRSWENIEDLDFNYRCASDGVRIRYKGKFEESLYVQVKIDDNNEIKELICSCFEQRKRKKNLNYLYVFSAKYI